MKIQTFVVRIPKLGFSRHPYPQLTSYVGQHHEIAS